MPTTVTKTIKSSGGDYTSLTAWEADRQRDLVAADEIEQAECYDFDLEDTVQLNGWTTDATRYIRIYTPTAERHDGRPRAVSGTGFRIKSGENSDATVWNFGVSFLRLEGLDILNNHSTVGDHGIDLAEGATGGLQIVDSCIVRNATNTGRYNINLQSGSTDRNTRILNTVCYGKGNGLRATHQRVEIYNCTVLGEGTSSTRGIFVFDEATIRNTYCGGPTAYPDGDFWTGSTPTGSHNASSDTTAGSEFTSSLSTVTASACFTSLAPGAEDFSLKSGCQLIDAGTTATGVSTDIIGNTRS